MPILTATRKVTMLYLSNKSLVAVEGRLGAIFRIMCQSVSGELRAWSGGLSLSLLSCCLPVCYWMQFHDAGERGKENPFLVQSVQAQVIGWLAICEQNSARTLAI